MWVISLVSMMRSLPVGREVGQDAVFDVLSGVRICLFFFRVRFSMSSYPLCVRLCCYDGQAGSPAAEDEDKAEAEAATATETDDTKGTSEGKGGQLPSRPVRKPSRSAPRCLSRSDLISTCHLRFQTWQVMKRQEATTAEKGAGVPETQVKMWRRKPRRTPWSRRVTTMGVTRRSATHPLQPRRATGTRARMIRRWVAAATPATVPREVTLAGRGEARRSAVAGTLFELICFECTTLFGFPVLFLSPVVREGCGSHESVSTTPPRAKPHRDSPRFFFSLNELNLI